MAQTGRVRSGQSSPPVTRRGDDGSSPVNSHSVRLPFAAPLNSFVFSKMDYLTDPTHSARLEFLENILYGCKGGVSAAVLPKVNPSK